MKQLPIGPPTKPPTALTPEGIAKIQNRLALVIDTRDFDDEMAPAVKNTVETLITQDIPALLAYVMEHRDEDLAELLTGERVEYTVTGEQVEYTPSIEEQIDTRFLAAAEHLDQRVRDAGPRLTQLMEE